MDSKIGSPAGASELVWDPSVLGRGLADLMYVQRQLQRATGNEQALDPDRRANWALFGFALIKETQELIDEFDWKPWRSNGKETPDPQKVAEEIADILAFLGTLINLACEKTNLTGYQLAQAYASKTDVNFERVKNRDKEEGGPHLRLRGYITPSDFIDMG